MGLIDQMMANLYKPPKQEKTNMPKNLTPAKLANMANQTTVAQGQLLKGEVLDLRANQILVLLENGATVSARTEGTLNLSIGQTARFFVAQTTEEQILLKLAKEDAPTENPMIDKALNAANIIKTERSVSIVTELLAHQQPVNEASIRHYLSLSAKYPDLPVKNLILMELHHIPVTKENVEQFVDYQNRNAKLLTQAQDMVKNLSEAIAKLPEEPAKQEIIQEFTKLVTVNNVTNTTTQTMASNFVQSADTFLPNQSNAPQTTAATILPDSSTADVAKITSEALPDNIHRTKESVIPEAANNATNQPSNVQTNTPANVAQTLSQNSSAASDSIRWTANHAGRPEIEPMFKDFLDSFLIKPEDIADPEKVQKYYDELNEKLTKLEHLSQKLAEHTNEQGTADAPKQMRQNLSFMEAVNNVFPYIQLPLKFKEAPAHGELYVYEKKKALKPSDVLSALLHLELEALGTMDIFVTLSGTHVTTRFSMTDKESGDYIRTELPTLTEALAAKGYTLQSEVSVREQSEENTPTLLEQFLEEHAPGGLNRYTFDIRA